jgi:large subunit ribosomal protein L23
MNYKVHKQAAKPGQERLMNVLLAPHVTEKTSQNLQLRNQYTFRVLRDATRGEVRAAVELMFDVKVAGVQVVNEPGKSRRFGGRLGRTQDWKKAYVRLAEGQSIDYEARREGLRHVMALIKLRPTSPGARFVVRVARGHLHKGGPLESLTVHQNKTGARNHSGRITTRHIGGGSRQKYRSSISVVTRTASRAWSSGSNTTRTAPRTSRWCCMPTASAATSSRPRG